MQWPNDLDPREPFLAHMYSGDEDNGDDITSGLFPVDQESDDYDPAENDHTSDCAAWVGEPCDCILKGTGARR